MGSYSRKRYPTESASFPKSASSAPGSYSYATFADLPASGSTPGNTAFVAATNKLYIWSGVGWYLIATVTNVSPTAITGVSDTYALATDGTATTITAVSTDPEGFALTWSYAVSSGSLGSTATVAQADNVFTITPSSTEANAGTFSLTFSVTDGLNGVVSAVSAFTLSFFIANSRYTTLSVKATATGSNQTFDDASTSNHTITAAGNSTASTFSPHRHGGYSTYFDGTGDYLSFPDSVDWDFGTGDFTVEGWVNPALDLAADTQFIGFGDGGNGGGNFGFEGTGQPYVYHNGYFARTSTALTLGSWSHIAFVRSSGTLSCYINGTSQASSSYTGNVGGTLAPRIGAYSGGQYFKGHMSDVRVVKGTAVYTSNFTPPTEPLTAITNTKFLLNPEPYFKDQSASNHTITSAGNVSLKPFSLFDNAPYSEADHGASAYFDGSGDYLTGPTPATIGIGTGDFTIECWFYATDATTDKGVWDTHTNASNSDGLTLTRITATTFRVWQSSQILVSSATAITDHWNHLAVVRNSGTLELFVNGVSQGTVSNSANLNSAQGILIGGGRYSGTTSPTQFVKGYIQDFRVTTSAVYTSAFTPPTAPLTTSPTYPALAIGVANSGASAYTLSGGVTGSNATVNMAVGQTVNFTVNASGHPFYIRVSDGGANVSTPTATGQGATSGVVSWTPNTAGTYYYQCGNHAGMIGTINVTDGVKFLSNPETSISDLSQKSTITCFGNAATSTTQVKFAGTKSIYGDGSGDYVSMPIDPIGTDDFTVEAWIYPTSMGSTATAISGATISGGLGVVMRLDQWFIGNNSTNQTFTSAANKFVVNQWQHIAMTRQGTSLRLFYNGTLFDSGTNSYNLNQTNYVLYAAYTNGSYLSFAGYIQDFRITKGLARYTSTFTPPTTELPG